MAAARRGTFRQEELRDDLKPFIDRLKDALSGAPERKMYTSEASKVLRVIPGSVSYTHLTLPTIYSV